MGSDAAPFTGQVDGITLQMADQHSDRNHQYQPIDTSQIPQPTAPELEDARFLVPEQLLTAEALPVSPDQIKAGLEIADQVLRISGLDTDGPGQKQIGLAVAVPEPHITEPSAMAAEQAGPAHLTAHRHCGAMNPVI